MRQIFLVISIVVASVHAGAQDFDRQKMDSLFAHITSNEKGMGSISIFANGEEIYQHAFGYASVEDSVAATRDTKYRIGSISKPFTAAIIMGLVEAGKLSLATSLTAFYPEITNAEDITIEHLLRHRSGIYNFTSAEDYTSWMEQPISRAELVKKIVANGSVFKPDEKAEYSNSNYVLLSFIAERLRDQKFAQIVQETICEPCSLENTYYGGAIRTENNEATSYTQSDGGQLATETDMSVPAGAGAMVSNPTDLNLFLSCLFNHKIVSEESLNAMMTLEDNYGMGLFQIPFGNRKAYGHNGGIDGFQSSAAHFPPEDVSVAFTSNGLAMSMNDVLIGVLSIYFGADYDFPEFTEPLSLTSEALDQYRGVYSGPDFPLKVTITHDGNVLMAQATGQPSFALEAYEPDKFRATQFGLKMDFVPKESTMILRQGGGEFTLRREE